jgi:CRP/FNR family transcriptional regulator, anaerobic regulatory protein
MERTNRCPHLESGCPARDAGLILREHHAGCRGTPVQGQITLERGELLHIQGQRGDYVYPVISGYLREAVGRADGRNHGIRMIGPGRLVGAEALMGLPYATTVDALTAVRVCRIRTREALSFLEAHPEHGRGLMRTLIGEILYLRDQITIVGSLSAEERVLRGLRALCDGEVGKWIELPITRRDFSELVNLAHTTASRTVRLLARRGLVEVRGRWIRLPASDGHPEG